MTPSQPTRCTGRTAWPAACLAALTLAAFSAQAQQPAPAAAASATDASSAPDVAADFEVTDPRGRRVIVKADGTWRFAEPAPSAAGAVVQAELTLSRLVATSPSSCVLELSLVNRLPYEIRSIVLDFSVLRADGVMYRTQNAGFTALRPGDLRQRNLGFDGIACREIATVRVWGGDRCEMGDLTRFSDANGACLTRIKVVPSTATKFEK